MREPSPELRALIEQRLHMLLTSEGEYPHERTRLAAEYRAVFLCYSLASIYLIRPDGVVLNVDADDGDQVLSEDDPERWLVLRQPNFPELAELLPERLEGAPDCPHCRGLGMVESGDGGEPRRLPCWGCSGLGWIHPVQGAERAEELAQLQHALCQASVRWRERDRE
jgi:hypothetical protein